MTEQQLEQATLAKVTRRLIPFLFLLYVFNYLDRVNISVAALTMKQDIRLSDAAYGFGAGIFFVGYVLFEVPSNLVMARVGARRWIARIMLSWGVISSCMMFARGPMSFYALRLLLGIAEAGFFPGMVVYLTYWFPASVRARAAAKFMVAGTVSGIVGGPVGAALLSLGGVGGLKGWQWLFLAEGIPSFILGFAVLRYLTDTPAQATWLTAEERDWLQRRMLSEHAHRSRQHAPEVLKALRHPLLLHLCALFFLLQLCGYGLGFWGPQILKLRSHWSDARILWLNSIPGIVGAVSMLFMAARSDRARNRSRFIAAGVAVGALGMICSAFAPTAAWTLAAFCLLSLGTGAANGPFWAICTSFLSGPAAAGGIAVINSVGNLGGLAGPWILGLLKQHSSGYTTGLSFLSVVICLAGILAGLLGLHKNLEFAADASQISEAGATDVT